MDPNITCWRAMLSWKRCLMSSRLPRWRAPGILRTAAATVAIAVLGACGTYVPEDSMVVSVKNSKIEFERGELIPARNELGDNRVIRMKWYDTNTFLTSGSLTPGVYSFRARNYEGGAFQQDIRIEPGKDLYELD